MTLTLSLIGLAACWAGCVRAGFQTAGSNKDGAASEATVFHYLAAAAAWAGVDISAKESRSPGVT